MPSSGPVPPYSPTKEWYDHQSLNRLFLPFPLLLRIYPPASTKCRIFFPHAISLFTFSLSRTQTLYLWNKNVLVVISMVYCTNHHNVISLYQSLIASLDSSVQAGCMTLNFIWIPHFDLFFLCFLQCFIKPKGMERYLISDLQLFTLNIGLIQSKMQQLQKI